MILSIKRFLKGMVIGIANIIPGVSGGTMALVLNVYEPLIEGIHNISLNTLKSFFLLFTFKKENTKNFGEEMKKIKFGLLFLVIAGAGCSILLFSGLMTFLIQNYQAPTFGFFFGLIIVSIAIPFGMIKKINFKVILALIIAIALIVGLSMLETDEMKIKSEEQAILLDEGETLEQENSVLDYLYIALCGGVSMSTMIIPGVSGAFVLLLMGKYFSILEAVSNLDFAIICVFAVGALLGLLLFSRFLNFLLKKYHDTTMGFLTGLVVGSLWAIWPFKAIHTLSNGENIPLSNIIPKQFGSVEIYSLLTIFAGVVVVLIMIDIEKKNKKRKTS